MDATAVAAARGCAAPLIRARHLVRIGLLFGGFQALMPFFGWMVGSSLGPLVAAWDHWIVFALLTAIGSKMLLDARSTPDAPLPPEGLFRVRVLVLLALATSIDAFAAGITLPMLGAPLLLSLVTIGVTTALLSAGGVLLGRWFGRALGRRLDAVGGVVLVLFGVKILVEHLSAH